MKGLSKGRYDETFAGEDFKLTVIALQCSLVKRQLEIVA